MSDEPSTSGEGAYSENEKSKLLQQALSEAGAKRAQAQRKRKSGESLGLYNTEEQKTRIRQHPLMPILLMNKLEEGCSHMQRSAFKIEDVIQQLAQMEQDKVAILTGDKEIDELMTSSILSLRTQLAELQKVSTLTDSFFLNYTTKLKKRVNQETLVGTGGESDDELETPTPEDELRRLHPSSLATLTTANGMMTLPLRLPPHPLNFLHSSTNGNTRNIFPVDVSPSMPMPFAHLPFFSFPQLQSLQRQAASKSAEETTES